ncbi:hypothetical protein BegalDRAFT_0381 [Beggiatoa alba B18LD]|uniref:Uncharacterized protein n=1 Tax=Beggiatoa alba B18LD TaxID=395493 RepID=I3CCF8_9GAMM|nr:lipoprotein [Beggiatoa alba]EIJ41301.1 hypothetical protein BegalDRAFT_0381 [Beggiatoa alba B18LD]
MKKLSSLSIVLWCCSLAACGQKGDLVRPVPEEVQAMSATAKKTPEPPVTPKTNE